MNGYPSRVTLSDDGVYRWHYDMDMYGNKSMLYTLEKVNLFIFLGVSIGGALLVKLVESYILEHIPERVRRARR